MKKLLILASISIVALGACQSPEDVPDLGPVSGDDTLREVVLSAAEQEVAKGVGVFYGNMLDEMIADLEESPYDKNPAEEMQPVMVSPLSAALHYAMLSNAVEGTLKNEILASLHCSDHKALNSLMGKLSRALHWADTACTMSVPNSVWYDSRYELNKEFKAVMQTYYKTPVYACDFQSPIAVDGLNSWIEKEMNGKIKNFMDKFFPKQTFALTNVVYFNGKWTYPFETSSTSKEMFYGTMMARPVDMMCKTGPRSYIETADFQAVVLPFGNARFQAVFAMDKAGKKMKNADVLAAYYRDEMKSQRMDLQLPKFTAKCALNINSLFARLGVHIDNQAEIPTTMFTKAATTQINVLQGAVVSFNETGAEVAAVTSEGYAGAGPQPEMIDMHFNRPFSFFIVEKSTGACLIAGRVNNL